MPFGSMNAPRVDRTGDHVKLLELEGKVQFLAVTTREKNCVRAGNFHHEGTVRGHRHGLAAETRMQLWVWGVARAGTTGKGAAVRATYARHILVGSTRLNVVSFVCAVVSYVGVCRFFSP